MLSAELVTAQPSVVNSVQPQAVHCQNLVKQYGTTFALQGVSFSVAYGAFVSLMGPSGCGKSTLLNCLGTMDTPTSGTLKVLGETIPTLNDSQRTRFRREQLGFVFQFFNLLEGLTALENVLLPLHLAPYSKKEATQKALQWLEKVGLQARSHHYPYQLSGGEMQRVAIARALIHEPKLLLADEPTGNLDSETGAAILELLNGLNKEEGLTIIMATHSQEAANVCSTVLRLKDGLLLP
jgi:putative ABC transport system ATP-binding protein